MSVLSNRPCRAKSRHALDPAVIGRCVPRLRSGWTVLLVGGALAACGGKEELRPAAGDSLPPTPVGVATPPTPTELMKPEVQARPRRSDELLRKSEERRDDRFDLPPK